MYCAKCGAQNEAGANDCSQCGEALQRVNRPSKFKGTMMMSAVPEGSAGTTRGDSADAHRASATAAVPTKSVPGAPTMKKTMVGVPTVTASSNKLGTPGKPGMARTMVGVSPFAQTTGLGPAAAGPTPRPAQKHAPKQTMMGVAAMGLDAAQAGPVASDSRAAGRAPLESGPAPRGESPNLPQEQAANLKRTMVGVSPFANEQSPAAPKPVQQQHVPKKTMMGVAAMGVGAAPSPATDTTGGAKPNLKKTMVGVSPFGDAATGSPARVAKPSPKKTMVGVAAVGLGVEAPTRNAPDIKATMIGTSPFGEHDDASTPAAAKPDLKRTVVGMAAFDAADSSDSFGETATPDPNPAFKGTMVGMMPLGAEQTGGGVDATIAMPQIDPSSMEPVRAPRVDATAPNGTPAWADPAAAAPGLGVHRPIGKTRSVGLSVLWMMLMIPGIIQFFRMLGELNRFRATDDISPWPFFVPVLSLIKAIELPGKLRESKQMAGIANATAPNILLFLIVPGPLFAASLNEIWRAARNNAE